MQVEKPAAVDILSRIVFRAGTPSRQTLQIPSVMETTRDSSLDNWLDVAGIQYRGRLQI